MRAGRLDRRVTVQVRTQTQGVTGEQVDSWSDLTTLWMGVTDAGAKERYAAAQVVAEIDTVFVARWSPLWRTIFADKHRLVWNGRAYNIAGIKEIGRKDGVEISALARAEA